MRRPFTKDDIDLIIRKSSSSTPEEIADMLGRSKDTVKHKMRSLGVYKRIYMNTNGFRANRSLERKCSQAIDSAWKNSGYDVDIFQDDQGFTRTNLVNGLPEGVESAREFWEKSGKEMFRKAVRGN